MPIHVTSEHRRGPLTYFAVQGGSKTRKQFSLEQCSTLQAFCPIGYSYSLVRHTALHRRL